MKASKGGGIALACLKSTNKFRICKLIGFYYIGIWDYFDDFEVENHLIQTE